MGDLTHSVIKTMGAETLVSSPAPVRAGALQVRVRAITYLCEGVNSYELVPLEEGELPAFSAGSHIDLYFRDGRVRQYSLCNDPSEKGRYLFAVQREELGRGGSKAIHEIVHAGRILAISQPRNNFPLHEDAPHHVLIAGGIGVTPMVAMVHRLLAIGASFELHYGVRTRSRLAFRTQLDSLGMGSRLHVYVDGGDPSRGMDVQAVVRGAPAGSHFYCCGPEGLMRALRRAALHCDPATVHFEHFAAASSPAVPGELIGAGSATIGVGFKVRLARTGGEFDVPDDKSIVEVLRENGFDVATSCEAGLCGTCRTRYLEGEPEHRDYILEDEEKRRDIIICCSRSRTPTLVLDL
jgi:vanillate O-demethylase ferredoxin subunit